MASLFKLAAPLTVGGALVFYSVSKGERFSRNRRVLAAETDSGSGLEKTPSLTRAPVPEIHSGTDLTDFESYNKQLRLKNVQVFFRHGARTPLRHAPGIEEVVYDRKFLVAPLPYTEVPYVVHDLYTGNPPAHSTLETRYQKTHFPGGCHAGMLTTVGKDQMYLVGRRIRKRYIEQLAFLGKEFDFNEVFLRSTNVQRCVDSLQCVLAGLYGQHSFDDKEPVVIPVSPLRVEILFPNQRHCDTLKKMEVKVSHVVPTLPEIKGIHDKIARIIDYKEKKPMEMMCWRDNLVAREAHGLPVPQWLAELKDEVEVAAVEAFKHYICGEPEDRQLVLMLSAGPMLHLISEHMKHSVNNTKLAKKMHMYSAHDSSLLPLLLALDCFDSKWPPYGADICIELYVDEDEQHWVKIMYCGQDVVPNGADGALMTLEDFEARVSRYRTSPELYKLRCQDIELAREHAAALESEDEEEEDDEDADEVKVPPRM